MERGIWNIRKSWIRFVCLIIGGTLISPLPGLTSRKSSPPLSPQIRIAFTAYELLNKSGKVKEIQDQFKEIKAREGK